MNREQAVLDARLGTLKQAITDRDWEEVERQYDRVLSQASRMAGTRGRPYDAPQPDAGQTSPAPVYNRPDVAPGTVLAADGKTILHSYAGQFVIYAQNAEQARGRVALTNIYLDAAALLYDLPVTPEVRNG